MLLKRPLAEQSFNAGDAARRYFETFNTRGVALLPLLFSRGATIEVLPLGINGAVEHIGPDMWQALFDGFPNLQHDVRVLSVDETGRRASADLYMVGQQARDVFGIRNAGRSFRVRQMAFVDIDPMGSIQRMACLWDAADWYRQLGRLSVV